LGNQVDELKAAMKGKEAAKLAEELGQQKTLLKQALDENTKFANNEEKWVTKCEKLKAEVLEYKILSTAVPHEELRKEVASLKKALKQTGKGGSSDVTTSGKLKALQAEKDELLRNNKELGSENRALENEVESKRQEIKTVKEDFKEARRVARDYERKGRQLLDTITKLKQKGASNEANGTANQDPGTPNQANDAPVAPVNAQVSALQKENEKLKAANKRLVAALEKCRKALRDGGKYLKEEISDSAVKAIKTWIRDVSYHTTKFIADDDQFQEFCKGVYAGVKNNPTLGWADETSEHHVPVNEFLRIYSPTCRTELNQRRQCTQTQCLRSAIGAFYP
jgi:predicted  nucleic acid-binding Zn-ribbon protein